MAATRIYVVRDGDTSRLVRATHPNHAVRHVAESRFEVDVASQDTLVELLGQGVTVEHIAAEQQELPTA